MIARSSHLYFSWRLVEIFQFANSAALHFLWSIRTFQRTSVCQNKKLKKENFARTWRRAAVPFTMERVPDAFFVAFKARSREIRRERNRGEEPGSHQSATLFLGFREIHMPYDYCIGLKEAISSGSGFKFFPTNRDFLLLYSIWKLNASEFFQLLSSYRSH